jgi:peptidoglycan/LPS O-acetylase OafA/YrhL
MQRLYGLDLIRGLLALIVAAYHFMAYSDLGVHYSLGSYPVYCFFALSGFVMIHVYGDMEITTANLKRFYAARVFRIMPLWIAILAVIFALAPITWHSVNRLLLNATFLSGFTNPGIHIGFAGGWSIAIEFVFYATFPLFLLVRRISALAVLFVVSVVTAFAYLNQLYLDPVQEPQGWMHHHQFVTFLPYFLGGALMARIYARLPQGFGWGGLGLSLLLLALMCAWPFLFKTDNRTFLIGPVSLLMLTFCIAIVGLGARVKMRGAVAWVASYLGDISFAVYLLHYPILLWVKSTGERPAFETIAIAAGITLVVATLVHYLFEGPARRLGHFLTKRPALQPAE